MTIVLKSYHQDKLYIECELDKTGVYAVFVGEELRDGLVHTVWERTYGTKEQAMRSFHRQVAKAKN